MSVAIIIICVLLAFVIFAAVFVILHSTKGTKRNVDIHVSGGANIKRGYISSDNNYFKGFSGELEKTVVLGVSNKMPDLSRKDIELVNTLTSKSNKFTLNPDIVIGRSLQLCVFVLTNDASVSKEHCRLFLYGGAVYIEDLHSSNHTFVNGKRIDSPKPLLSGDIIGVGNTQLKIVF